MGYNSQCLLLIQKRVKEKQGLERKTGKASDYTQRVQPLERQHPPHLPFSVGFQHVCLRWDQKGISVCCLHWYIHPGVTSAREAQGASSSPGVDAQLHIGLIVGVNELMEVYESV